ncbi:MAG: hypothetical protein VKJ24_10285 [Synechococcales bacterium]|nr:hypothetical protein [Synechococcales bacterium]
MSEFLPPEPSVSNRSTQRRSLNLQEKYPCPVCQHGEIQPMVMMDAYSCPFCRHLFSVNLEAQILRLEDAVQPMMWRWNGRRWRSLGANVDLSILVWLSSLVLVVLPAGLIWLCAYIFPPLEGLHWNSFPIIWGEIVCAIHSGFAFWLLAEHYQFPTYITCKIGLAQLLARLFSTP